MSRAIAFAVVVMFAGSVLAAEPVRFARPPSVSRDGGQVDISFALSAPADVEVAVLDDTRRIVRHLAAGMVGAEASGPFAAGLAQSVKWDGKDDFGQAVNAAAVRVAIGMQPKLEKVFGWDGNSFGGSVFGLAVGKGGELFVLLGHGSRGASSMRVFSRDGKYLRTIMPYPATLPKDRLAPLGQLEIDGRNVPIIYNAHAGNLLPCTNGMKRQNMAFAPQGHMVMASALGSMEEHGPPRFLLALAPDGGAPNDVAFIGPKIRDEIGMMGGVGESYVRLHESLAVSPDGQFVYYSHSRIADKRPRHCIFRIKWTDARADTVFLGADGVSGDGDNQFNNPAGIALDKAGNLYVCDNGNNRVVVFSPDGRKLDSFPVEDPEQIAVHPATGHIYVLSRKLALRVVDATLRKFSARGSSPTKELARLDLPKCGEFVMMALDGESAPARLWVSTGRPVFPIDDAGEKFERGASIETGNGIGPVLNMAVDPARNRLYLHDIPTAKGPLKAIDLASGKITSHIRTGQAPAVDRDGNIYVLDGYGSNSMSRYTADGTPLPFPATGSHKLNIGYYRGFGPDIGCGRGLCVAPNGDIYFLRSGSNGLENANPAQVDVWSPEGTLKQAAIIDGIAFGDCGLGVDAAGNIYLGSNFKPKDEPLPREFVGQASPDNWRWWRRDKRQPPWFYCYVNPYLTHFGAVVKFTPAGGAFYGRVSHNLKPGITPPRFDMDKAPADAIEFMDGYLERPVKVSGMQWRYHGMFVPHSNLQWGDPGCCCVVSQMGVDGFGRVFAPNIFRFTVDVLDANGKLITRIGRYGNVDDPGQDISFARPLVATAAAGKLYVGDPASQRISVISLVPSAQQDVPLR